MEQREAATPARAPAPRRSLSPARSTAATAGAVAIDVATDDADGSGFGCVGASPTVTADSLEVALYLSASTQAGGWVDVFMDNEEAIIDNLDIKLSGVAGFLFNWIFNFFEEGVAENFEEQILQQLATFPDLLAVAMQQIGFNTEEIFWDPGQLLRLVIIYLLLAVPFFFAGCAIGIALMGWRESIPRLYGADLAGAGIGSAISSDGISFEYEGRGFWTEMDSLVELLDGVAAEEASDA